MGQWLSDRLGQPFEQVGDPWHVNRDVRDILRSPRRRAGAVAANLHLHMFTCSNRVSSTALASVHHQPKKKLPIQARLIARRVHKPIKAPRCCVRPGTVSLTGWFIADPKEGPRRSRVEKSRPAGDRRPAAKKRLQQLRRKGPLVSRNCQPRVRLIQQTCGPKFPPVHWMPPVSAILALARFHPRG